MAANKPMAAAAAATVPLGAILANWSDFPRSGSTAALDM
jgi:hypothetical protein